MSRIFFDTNLFIYLIEGSGPNKKRAVDLVGRIYEREDEIVTSSLTLAELLVKPLAANHYSLADEYEALLQSPVVSVVDFNRACAWQFAAIRRDKTIKAPDAIQLACASVAKCDLFITNDVSLTKKKISGIQFIASFDRVSI